MSFCIIHYHTTLIINNKNLDDFKTTMNNAYQDLNNWFKQNLLCLNYQKSRFLHFKITSNSIDINMDIWMSQYLRYKMSNF
jgi:hypothetical protein